MNAKLILESAKLAINLAPVIKGLFESLRREPTIEEIQEAILNAQLSGDKIDELADKIREERRAEAMNRNPEG